MRVFIHTGTYKTGTTAVQESLYSNRVKLLEKGVLYPKAGISSRSDEIGPRHSRLIYEYDKKSWDKLVGNLFEEIFSTRAETVVISSEAWSRPGAIDSLYELISRLEKSFGNCDVSIITVFRNIYEYSVSHYREFVRRWGWSLTYEEYAKKRLRFFNYAEIAERMTRLPVSSSKFFMYDKSVVDNIFSYMGLSEVFAYEYYSRKKSNKGVSALDAEVLRIANKYKLEKILGSDLPTPEEVFGHYGLGVAEGSSFIDGDLGAISPVVNKSIVERFKKSTGFSNDAVDAVFRAPRQDGAISVGTLRPILEKACFDYCAAASMS